MLPAPSGFQALAKSPASAQLASDFFALERKRELASFRQPAATSASASQVSQLPVSGNSMSRAQLSSQEPVFSRTLDGAFRLDEYHPLEEIYEFLDALPARYKRVQVFTIGRSAEKRPIKALELINNATDSDFVWLDALTHAREWITGSTILHLLDQLVAGAAWPLGAKNFIIVPVVNPDGYAYTWTSNRMWRKNRSRSSARAPDSKCVGVSTALD